MPQVQIIWKINIIVALLPKINIYAIINYMNEQRREIIIESPVLVPPPVESFSSPTNADITWPKRITTDREFLSQMESRRELNRRLDVVISKLPRPDMSLREAIPQHHLTENQVADLYASLSSLLESGSDYERLVLYLPFEFLPNTAWKPSTDELQQAIKRFKTAYMSAWNDLLTIHDVRANFVDGDVLEVAARTKDLPRVVKAAHLIPKLIENGFLEIEDILKLLEASDDETLRHSIADTLPVLADLGYIKESDLAEIDKAGDSYLHDKIALIASFINKTKKEEVSSTGGITLSSLQEELHRNFENIDVETYPGVTEKRAAWLRQEKKRKAIESASDAISVAITGNTLESESLKQFITSEVDPEGQQAMIDGIRKAIESVAHLDQQQAQSLYAKYREMLLSLWKQDIPEVQEALTKTFCRLHGLDIVDDEQLSNLGITIPALAGPFSENLKMMRKEMGEIGDIAASIEKDGTLLKYIYPVVLVFGSRLKGYGTQTADIDVAIFVRPGIAPGDEEKMWGLLKKAFAHEKIHGEIVEFWLEKTADGLAVRDTGDTRPWIGNSLRTHVLFGAAWEGNKAAINELREQLLVPYFYDKGKIIHGRRARGLYLEELERDTLQYRLMHKGYERFFPAYGGINTPHADQIDGQSIFWDSGYRQVATKLFASRVFLPKLDALKK